MSYARHSSETRSSPQSAETRARLERTGASAQAAAVDGLILLTGVYTAISPWVVHFSGTNPHLTVNNLVVGLAIAAIGFGRTLAPQRTRRLSWTMAPLGLWLIASPSFVTAANDVSARIVWSNGWAGGITCLLGLIAANMTSLWG